MAVMLYGIVSTTRAKQIAQTGIVPDRDCVGRFNDDLARYAEVWK